MCGIFYYQTFQCGTNGISTSKAKRLFADFAKIQHRGPDNSQFQNYVASTSSGPMSYIFGFHRLAINGLGPDGNQPFSLGACKLVCNGEIYNYRDLGIYANDIEFVDDAVNQALLDIGGDAQVII